MKDLIYSAIGDVLWALDRSRWDELLAVCAGLLLGAKAALWLAPLALAAVDELLWAGALLMLPVVMHARLRIAQRETR